MKIGETTYALFPSDDKFNCGALAQGEYYKPSVDGVVIYLNGGNNLQHSFKSKCSRWANDNGKNVFIT